MNEPSPKREESPVAETEVGKIPRQIPRPKITIGGGMRKESISNLTPQALRKHSKIKVLQQRLTQTQQENEQLRDKIEEMKKINTHTVHLEDRVKHLVDKNKELNEQLEDFINNKNNLEGAYNKKFNKYKIKTESEIAMLKAKIHTETQEKIEAHLELGDKVDKEEFISLEKENRDLHGFLTKLTESLNNESDRRSQLEVERKNIDTKLKIGEDKVKEADLLLYQERCKFEEQKTILEKQYKTYVKRAEDASKRNQDYEHDLAKLRSELEHLKERNKELYDEKLSVHLENARLTSEENQRCKDDRIWEQDLADAKDETIRLENLLKKSRGEQEKLISQLALLQKQCEDYKTERRQLQDIAREEKAKLRNQLEQEHELLEEKIKTLVESNESFSLEISDWKHQLQEAKMNFSSREEAFERNRLEMKEHDLRMTKDFEKRVKELRSTFQQKNETELAEQGARLEKRYTLEIAELRTQIESSEQITTDLERQLGSKTSEIEEMKRYLILCKSDVAREVGTLKGNLYSKFERDLVQIDSFFEDSINSVQQLTDFFSLLKTEIAAKINLGTTFSELASSTAVEKRVLDEEVQTLSELLFFPERLNSGLWQETRAKLVSRVNLFLENKDDNTLAGSGQEMWVKEQELQEIKERAAEYASTIEKLEDKVRVLSQEKTLLISAQDEQHQYFSSQRSEFEGKKNEWRMFMEEQRKKLNETQRCLRDKEKETDSLHLSLQQKEKEIVGLQKQLDEAKGDHAQKLKILTEKIQELNSANQVAEKESRAQLEQEKKAFLKDSQDWKIFIEDQRNHLHQEQNKVKERESQLDTQSEQSRQQLRQLEVDMTTKYEQKMQQLRQREHELNMKQEDIIVAQREMEKLTMSHSNAEQQFKQKLHLQQEQFEQQQENWQVYVDEQRANLTSEQNALNQRSQELGKLELELKLHQDETLALQKRLEQLQKHKTQIPLDQKDVPSSFNEVLASLDTATASLSEGDAKTALEESISQLRRNGAEFILYEQQLFEEQQRCQHLEQRLEFMELNPTLPKEPMKPPPKAPFFARSFLVICLNLSIALFLSFFFLYRNGIFPSFSRFSN